MADSRVPYDQAIAYQSMDLSKTDLELVCGLCPIEDNVVLCDIEATDSLEVLMDVFKSHWLNQHAALNTPAPAASGWTCDFCGYPFPASEGEPGEYARCTICGGTDFNEGN